MGNFDGFSSRWSSDFGAYHKPPPKPKKKSTHWYDVLTEVTGNLLGDVRDAAVGLPAGLKAMATDPIKSTKAIGKASWATYSPLFEGDVGEFLHNVKEHPLQPILDAATIATLGGAAAGSLAGTTAKGLSAVGASERVVQNVSKVGASRTIDLTARGQILHGKGVPKGIALVHERGNPVLRMRQKGTRAAGNKLASALGSAEWKGGSLETKGLAKVMGDAHKYKKGLGKMEASRSIAVSQLHAELLKSSLRIKNMSGPDIWDKLEPHFGKTMDNHVRWIREADLRKGGKSGLARGFQFRRDPKLERKKYTPKDNSPDEMAKAIERWKHDEVTNVPADALRNAKGELAVLRSAPQLLKEADNSYRAIHAIHSKPMAVWKWMVLAASPRFFVNNVVGNTLMYAMATNPKASVEGIIHTTEQLYGKKKALRKLQGADKELARMEGDAIKQYVERETMGFAGGLMEESQRGVNPLSGRSRAKHAVKGGLYPITHRLSDTWIRRSTINYAAKRTAPYQLEYQQLRANGIGRLEAHNIALGKALEDVPTRDWIVQSMDNVLGDYTYLNKTERAVKAVVPFYTWDRAIMRHTSDMVMNRPYEAAMLSGIGFEGVEETRKALGFLPDFLKGAIPVGNHTGGILGFLLGVTAGSRTRILTTQGLNPYSTVPDIAEAAASLVGVGDKKLGETVGSQISPFLGGAAESLSGTSLLSGAPIEHRRGGMVGDIIGDVGENTPQFRLLESLLNGGTQSKDPKNPRLFTSDSRQQLSGFLGAPLKDLSPIAAQKLYDRQHGIKKRRTYAPSRYSGFYTRSDIMPKF